MSLSERRLQSRFLCADLVRVWWSEVTGGASAEALLEDISELGASVQVEQAIPLDSPITLSIGEERFRGRVCYCVFRDYGHFVGIRFSADTVWSSDMVTPQHLTNLETIGRPI